MWVYSTDNILGIARPPVPRSWPPRLEEIVLSEMIRRRSLKPEAITQLPFLSMVMNGIKVYRLMRVTDFDLLLNRAARRCWRLYRLIRNDDGRTDGRTDVDLKWIFVLVSSKTRWIERWLALMVHSNRSPPRRTLESSAINHHNMGLVRK